MITQKSKNIGGLLLKVAHRSAGEMEKNGKLISWEERYQLVILPFEDDRNIVKYSINPACEDKILRQLDEVHWATLIELELDGREVVSVEVVSDILRDFYESN